MSLEIYKKMKYDEVNHHYEMVLTRTTIYTVGDQNIKFKNGMDLVLKFSYLKEYCEMQSLDIVILRDVDHNQYNVTFDDFVSLRFEMIERGISLQSMKSNIYDSIKNATTVDEVTNIKMEM